MKEHFLQRSRPTSFHVPQFRHHASPQFTHRRFDLKPSGQPQSGHVVGCTASVTLLCARISKGRISEGFWAAKSGFTMRMALVLSLAARFFTAPWLTPAIMQNANATTGSTTIRHRPSSCVNGTATNVAIKLITKRTAYVIPAA